MKRKEALAELIEDVSQDDWPTPANCKDAKISHSQTEKAFEGSLDAAKALHEALLPGWDWVIGRTNDGLTVHANVGNEAEAFDDCPARAWLLAILRALHSMEPEA